MKAITLCVWSLAVVVCSTVNAASLSLTQNGDIFSLYLAGEEDNGNFDTVDVEITPWAGTTFARTDFAIESFVPFPPGQPFTYINQFLGASPAQGGEGWSVLGVWTIPTRVAFAGGPLGQTISTAAKPGGRLFLANMVLSPPSGNADARVQLISAGNVIEELRILFVIPEPATLAIAGLGLIGVVAASRRKA